MRDMGISPAMLAQLNSGAAVQMMAKKPAPTTTVIVNLNGKQVAKTTVVHNVATQGNQPLTLNAMLDNLEGSIAL